MASGRILTPTQGAAAASGVSEWTFPFSVDFAALPDANWKPTPPTELDGVPVAAIINPLYLWTSLDVVNGTGLVGVVTGASGAFGITATLADIAVAKLGRAVDEYDLFAVEMEIPAGQQPWASNWTQIQCFLGGNTVTGAQYGQAHLGKSDGGGATNTVRFNTNALSEAWNTTTERSVSIQMVDPYTIQCFCSAGALPDDTVLRDLDFSGARLNASISGEEFSLLNGGKLVGQKALFPTNPGMIASWGITHDVVGTDTMTLRKIRVAHRRPAGAPTP